MSSETFGLRCAPQAVKPIWYPALGRWLRGVVATADIEAGESVCLVPSSSIFSDLTVGNSSLRKIGPPYAKLEQQQRTGGYNHEYERMILALKTVCIMRERERATSAHMGNLAIISSADVTQVPAMWEPGSARFKASSLLLQNKSIDSRRRARKRYDAIFPRAFGRFARELSEGLVCDALRLGADDFVDAQAAEMLAGAKGGGRAGGNQAALSPRDVPAYFNTSQGMVGHVCSHLVLKDIYSWPRFHRLWVQIFARNFNLPMYGTERSMLIPQVNLYNFGQAGVRIAFDDQQHALVATTTQRIVEGSEILFHYGSHCTEEYQDMYGFSPPTSAPCVLGSRAAPRDERCWRGFTCVEQDGRFIPSDTREAHVGHRSLAGEAEGPLITSMRPSSARSPQCMVNVMLTCSVDDSDPEQPMTRYHRGLVARNRQEALDEVRRERLACAYYAILLLPIYMPSYCSTSLRLLGHCAPTTTCYLLLTATYYYPLPTTTRYLLLTATYY